MPLTWDVSKCEDSDSLIAEGEWHGEILPALRGEGGFGSTG